jgi:hypothetical protein
MRTQVSWLCSSVAACTRPGIVKGIGRREDSTSDAVVIRAVQSTRGRTLKSSFGLGSIVSETSSQSFGCRGKEVEVLLQAFTAQVRKLRVRTFIAAFLLLPQNLRV